MVLPLANMLRTQELCPEEKEYLRNLTGNEYEYVIVGEPNDGRLGFVSKEGIDILTKNDGEAITEIVFAANIFRETPSFYNLLSDQGIEIDGHGTVRYGKGDASLTHSHEDKFIERLKFGITPQLEKLYSRYDSHSRVPIEFVHRDEPPEAQDKRVQDFGMIISTLAPEMRKNIRAVDFRPTTTEGLGGYASGSLGIIRLGVDDLSGPAPYHEAAHLLTDKLGDKFRDEWKSVAGDVYLNVTGNDYIRTRKEDKGTEDAAVMKRLNEKGIITKYAETNVDEDIAELTACIYTDPRRVKKMLEQSPIFEKKIALLYANGFIHPEQYLYFKSDGPAADQLLTKIEADFRIAKPTSDSDSENSRPATTLFHSAAAYFWKDGVPPSPEERKAVFLSNLDDETQGSVGTSQTVSDAELLKRQL